MNERCGTAWSRAAFTTGVDFIAVNGISRRWQSPLLPIRSRIGEKLTHGQRRCKPRGGPQSAEENRSSIAKALEGTDMVFITCGMGGGTGTGGSPIVADVAREMGILTVGVVTKPFGFGGARRMRQAVRRIESCAPRSTPGHYPQRASEAGHRSEDHLCQWRSRSPTMLKQAVESISTSSRTPASSTWTCRCDLHHEDAGLAHTWVSARCKQNKAGEAARMAISARCWRPASTLLPGVLVQRHRFRGHRLGGRGRQPIAAGDASIIAGCAGTRMEDGSARHRHRHRLRQPEDEQAAGGGAEEEGLAARQGPFVCLSSTSN